MELHDLTGMLWLLIISTAVLLQTGRLKASRDVKRIIMAGYYLRIGMAMLQAHAAGFLPGFLANDDQQKFLEIGLSYFHGDFTQYRTNFPYVINAFFHVFGTGDLTLRLFFIYLWFWGCVLLERTAKELKSRSHKWLIAFYSLLPWTFYTSTSILREPVKQYSLMLSFFFLLKWMEYGKLRWIAASAAGVLPALWLHNGDGAMVAVIFLTYVFWNPRKQEWEIIKISWKSALLFAGILSFPWLYNIFVRLFPGKFDGSFSVQYFLDQIQRAYVSVKDARTDYAANMMATDIKQLLFLTPCRMFFFWMSPAPGFWRSFADVFMFMADTIPWLIYFCCMVRAVRRKELGEQAKISLLIFMVFTFIYAWGTSNAGTAMRHRDHLLGIFVMAALTKTEPDKGIAHKRSTI